MPIKDYPFTPITQNHARPMLWIRVVNPKTEEAVVMQAIVDTGADSCAFPADVAEQLGHNLESVPTKRFLQRVDQQKPLHTHHELKF